MLQVGADGRKKKHGNRHVFCPHPALLLWHISNEYGNHCYCDQCAAALREWLHVRYGSLEEVNARWVTTFWGTPTPTGRRSRRRP